MKSLRFLALAVTVAVTGLSPAAFAQFSTVDLMVAGTTGSWVFATGADPGIGADGSPMAFAFRSTTYPYVTAPSGAARVILLARVTASPTTLGAINTAFGNQSGIDLAPDPTNSGLSEAERYQTGNANTETHIALVGNAPLKMHVASTQSLFATLKAKAATADWETAFPNELKAHSVPWANSVVPFPAQNGYPSAQYGLAMSSNNSDWVAGGFAEKFWPQSFLGRYTNSATTPGGTLMAFSPSRLVERCILNQSTNAYNAANFIRSTAYRVAYNNITFQNQFLLEVQALVVLPAESITDPVPVRRKIKVIKTDVYRRQVTLTPGSVLPGEAPDGSLALRPGIMFDVAGAGGPVCFNLGLAVDPVSATFAVPGSNAEAIEVPVFKLYPWDPLSTYYIALRPTNEASKIVNIGTTVPNKVEADPEVFILPPLADALPLG